MCVIAALAVELIDEASVGEPHAVEPLDIGELVEQQGDSAVAILQHHGFQLCTTTVWDDATATCSRSSAATWASTSLWLRLPVFLQWQWLGARQPECYHSEPPHCCSR